MKKVIVLCILFAVVPTMAQAYRLFWGAVSTYTDNTAIEPANLPVMYDAWQDGVPIAVGTTILFAPLNDNTKGKVSTYTIRARLTNGATSDNSVANLTSPLGQPKPPAVPMSVGN
jgi:hypothetical protein